MAANVANWSRKAKMAALMATTNATTRKRKSFPVQKDDGLGSVLGEGDSPIGL